MKLTYEKMIFLTFALLLLTAYHFVESNANNAEPQDALNFDKVGIGKKLSSSGSNIPPTIDGRTLKSLKSTIVHTQEGKTEVTQSLIFRDSGTDSIESGEILFTENNEGKTKSFLHFAQNADMFEYIITFNQGLQSRIEDNKLVDVEDETLFLNGGRYVFLNADVNTETNSVTLDLIGSKMDKTYLMEEQETKGIASGTKTIVVAVKTIDNDRNVVFTINGVNTKPLKAGNIYAFPDGIVLGVISVFEQESAEIGGEDKVEFAIGGSSFGGGRIRLTDKDYTDNLYTEGALEYSGNDISASRVQIKAQEFDDKLKISTIKIRMKGEGKSGDIFVSEGETISQNMREPVYFFPEIRFDGVGQLNEKKFKPSIGGIKFEGHNDGYRLIFSNNDGNVYNIPYVQDGLDFTDDDGRTLVNEEASAINDCDINEEDLFVVTSEQNGNGRTNVIQFDGFSESNKILHLTDVSTGRRDTTLQDSNEAGVNYEGTIITPSGMSAKVYVCTNGKISVDLNNDGDISGDEVIIATLGGGYLELGTSTHYIRESKYFDESRSDQDITISFLTSSGNLYVDVDTQSDLTMNDVGKGGATLSGINLNANAGDEVGLSSFGEAFVLEDGRRANNLIIAMGSAEIVNSGQGFGKISVS